MRYRFLGNTGLEVSTVAMGCWAIAGGGTWGEQDEGEALAAIGAALDAGINFFDTAEGYGESETLLGKGLGSRRHEAIVASKVSGSHMRPDQVAAACDRSLSNLGTGSIDLYQLHWPSREVPLADTIGALHNLQEQGKIRHFGVSNFGPRDLAEMTATGAQCVSNQVIYSLLARAIEFSVQPKCLEQNISALAYSPLAQGLLTGKFHSPDDVAPGRARTRHFSSDRPQTRHGENGCEQQTFRAIATLRKICDDIQAPMAEVSLAWCLHQPGVTAVIAGARSPEQARLNAAASERDLAPDILQRLSAATEEVKQMLGSSIDLWQGVAQSRSR